MTATRRISTARLLVGILLHFCVPAYLLFCVAAAFLKMPVVADWAAVPARMLWAAAWFVPGFVLAAAGAAGAGALVDRRRPRAPDAVAASRDALAEGRRLFAALPNRRLERAMAAIEAQRWNHAEPAHQRVAADLLAAARTFATAYASAADGRPAIAELAADSVERLAGAMAALADERRRLDEGDARTVAGYLAVRYGDGA